MISTKSPANFVKQNKKTYSMRIDQSGDAMRMRFVELVATTNVEVLSMNKN